MRGLPKKELEVGASFAPEAAHEKAEVVGDEQLRLARLRLRGSTPDRVRSYQHQLEKVLMVIAKTLISALFQKVSIANLLMAFAKKLATFFWIACDPKDRIQP